MEEKHVLAMILVLTTKVLVTKMADSADASPTLVVSTVTDVNLVSSTSRRMAARVSLLT